MNARKIVSKAVEGAVKETGRQLLEEAPAVVRVPARGVLRLKNAVPDKPKRKPQSKPLRQESLDRGRR